MAPTISSSRREARVSCTKRGYAKRGKIDGMRTLLALLLVCGTDTLVCAAQTGVPVSNQRFANLGDFALDNGQTIHDCRIGYRTYGQLAPDKSNAFWC